MNNLVSLTKFNKLFGDITTFHTSEYILNIETGNMKKIFTSDKTAVLWQSEVFSDNVRNIIDHNVYKGHKQKISSFLSLFRIRNVFFDKSETESQTEFFLAGDNQTYFEIMLVYHRESEGNVYLLTRDITDFITKKLNEVENFRLEKEFYSQMDACSTMIATVDISKGLYKITKYSEDSKAHNLREENKAWCDYEYVLNNIIIKAVNPGDFHSLYSATNAKSLIKKMQEGKTEFDIDYRIKSDDGSLKWRRQTVHLFINPSLGSLFANFYISDINRQKLSELLSEKYNAMRRNVAEVVDELYFSIYSINLADDTMCCMKHELDHTIKIGVDMPFSEQIGDIIDRNVHPDYRANMHKKLNVEFLTNNLTLKNPQIRIESKILAGEKYIWAVIDVRASRFRSGKAVSAVIVDKDVTADKIREKEFEHNKIMSQMLSASTTCAYTINIERWTISFITKPDGFDSNISDDMSMSEAIKCFNRDMNSSDYAENLEKNLSRENVLGGLKRNGEYSFEVKVQGSDEFSWYKWIISSIPGDDEYLLVRVIDISVQKKLQDAELQRAEAETKAAIEKDANRTKTRFLANMSHEIRTPLNAILGYGEILSLNPDLPEDISEDIRHITDASNTLLEIVNNILDITKVESGNLTIKNEAYDTSKLIAELDNSITPRIGSKPIDFSIKCDENVPKFLYGDPIIVKQIVMNLLTNAVKYTDKGTVVMSVSYNCGKISFAISDTGKGIKEEDIEKVFNRFERLENNIDRSIEGTGLGLPLTRELAERIGGEIRVESEFGKGSVFTAILPQEPTDLTAKDEPRKTEIIYAPGVRVLLVDDNRVNLNVMTRLLQKFKLQVDCAETGMQCLAMLAKCKYDIVFLDHMMPGMDGIETFTNIRKVHAFNDIPIVALTANAMTGVRDFYIKKGFNGYISKPVNLKTFGKILREWIPEQKLILKTDEEKQYEHSDVLSGCEGIDINSGIEYTGGSRNLINAINDFVGYIDERAKEIRHSVECNDIKSFIIEVHSLKSSSRMIGANELSEIAGYLERCGKDGNVTEIRKFAPVLIDKLEGYKQKLAPALKTSDKGKAIDVVELKEELENLKNALVDYDLIFADNWATRAKGYKVDERTSSQLCELFKAIKDVDYGLAEKLTDNLISKI